MEARVGSRLPLILPVGLIIVALAALVVVPLGVRLQSASMEQQRAEVMQPARDLVNTIQLSLAREMGALRGFVITEDESFLVRYEEVLEEERRAREALAPLVAELGPDVARDFAELTDRVARWHGRVTEAEILRRQLVPEAFIQRIPSEEVRYEEALDAAEGLRDRIVAEVDRNRAEIQRLESVGLGSTGVLALLALGAALGALWLGRHLRAYATEAERRRAEMERMSENRAQLIRGITHDLKNPLGAARGHLQLLRSGVVQEAEGRARGIERSDRAIGTALEIIDDLLRLSRAEEGELPISRSPTDLAAVVEEIAGDQQAQAERAGLSLDVELPERAPVVETDYRRVREIVRNLVSNAVKYTPEGGAIVVRVRSEVAAGREGDWVAVDVIDTGLGIPRADRERVFQEFARLGSGRGEVEGSGLGLAISRRVARLLGGDIEMGSEVGRGSTFTLRLPRS